MDEREKEAMKKEEELQEYIRQAKSWENLEEVKASERPVNSLIDKDLHFEKNVIIAPIEKDENQTIFKYICQRYKEKTFDNYEFKERKEEVVEEVYDTKMIETNKEIFDLYDKIEEEIKKMVDYGSRW